MKKLLIATRNANKTCELRELLGSDFEIDDLTERAGIPETVESGATFEENAILKAVAASRHFPGLVVADDSGLEVDALGGAPGVRSARYAGERANDRANRERLLRKLGNAPDRAARFRCVLALAENGISIATFNGLVEGWISESERGSHGFGYDSLFIPCGYDLTYAELPPEIKNRSSHRAAAIGQLLFFLTTDR